MQKVSVCGAPGLVDRVFAFHADSRGFDSHRRHMFERFFRSIRPGHPHPVCSELGKVASERRSVIAVSLNVGGGVHLIKPTRLYMCMQNTTHTEVMCLICTVGQWPHLTSTTGTNKNNRFLEVWSYTFTETHSVDLLKLRIYECKISSE